MKSDTNFAEIARMLTASLELKQPPIAISFSDSLPAGIPAHTGRAPAGCRFWEDAAAGAFATTAGDHNRCAIGVYTHNLEPSPEQQTDLMDALKVFADLGYVTQADLPLIPVLKSQRKYVVYYPLARAPLSPDVVMLFVHANQTLVLSEATQQLENQTPPAMGRPACAVVPQVMNTGRAALSLGCCGARAYLDVFTDEVAVFALPGSRLAAYTERIAVLAKANAVLTKFHHVRRQQIESGQTPTIKESLATLTA
jgi:uncharacterized protein (DUF169 family)